MAASKYYLNDSGTNEVIQRLKEWSNASFALKSAITDDGKVVYYNELPSSLPYASSGTHTAVSHGDHTHSYVPIAGNDITHPMTGKIIVSAGTGGMRAILYNLNSSGTGTTQSQNQTNLISMTTSNIIQVGGQASDNSASSPTAPARLELYGGNARIIYAPLSSIQFNVGYGLWYHNNNVSPSTSIRAMTIDREGTSNVYNLNIGEAVNHTQTYIYGGSESKVNVKSSEIILDTDRGVSFAVSSTLQADGIRLVSTGAEVVVSLGGRTGHGRTYIYGGSAQSVRVESADLLLGRRYGVAGTSDAADRGSRLYMANIYGTLTNRNASFSQPITNAAVIWTRGITMGTSDNTVTVGEVVFGNTSGYSNTRISGGETGQVVMHQADLVFGLNYGIIAWSDELPIYHGRPVCTTDDDGKVVVTKPTRCVNIDSGNLHNYLVDYLPKATKELFGDISGSMTFTNEYLIQTVNKDKTLFYHYEFPSLYDGEPINSLVEDSRYYIFRMGETSKVKGLSTTSVWDPAYEKLLLSSYAARVENSSTMYTHNLSYFYEPNSMDHVSTRMTGFYEIRLTVRGQTTNGNAAHLVINVWAKYARHLRDKNGVGTDKAMRGDEMGITYAAGADIPTYPYTVYEDECLSRNTLSFPQTNGGGPTSNIKSITAYQTMSIFRSLNITGSTVHTQDIEGSDGYYYSTDAVGIYIQYSPYVLYGDTLKLDHVAMTLTRLNYVR